MSPGLIFQGLTSRETYKDVGKRPLEPHGEYRELNGVAAKEYLEKAETMFREMDLQWNLEELEKDGRTGTLPVIVSESWSPEVFFKRSRYNR